jgi:hypothetical protein
MSDAQTQTEVLYCYRCGKRVKRNAMSGGCWYCSAPIRRHVRPPRKCPFCSQHIAHDAIKCHHCGEFLDGRPGNADGGAPRQITFVIDKAVIQGDQPLMLQGGGDMPENVARLLTQRTVEAIRSGEPSLIDQEGVKALPAPEGGGGAMVPAEYSLAPVDRRALAPVSGPALDLEASPTDLLTTTNDDEGKYRQCKTCETEILVEDNYCFHCGGLQRKEAAGPRRMPNLADPSNAPYLLLSLFFMAVFLYLGREVETLTFRDMAYPTAYAVWGLASVSLLLIGGAFIRRKTLVHRALTLVVFLLWLVSLGGALI